MMMLTLFNVRHPPGSQVNHIPKGNLVHKSIPGTDLFSLVVMLFVFLCYVDFRSSTAGDWSAVHFFPPVLHVALPTKQNLNSNPITPTSNVVESGVRRVSTPHKAFGRQSSQAACSPPKTPNNTPRTEGLNPVMVEPVLLQLD